MDLVYNERQEAEIVTLTVNIHEAKTHLSKLLERVMNGEQIIIAKAGKPVAILAPITEPPERRTPGNDAGKVRIAADFDAPLPEFDS
jgi:prevent-host-death family protein